MVAMSEDRDERPTDDQAPAPLEHADAERVPDAERSAAEIEDDPAQSPGEGPLRDIKGG